MYKANATSKPDTMIPIRVVDDNPLDGSLRETILIDPHNNQHGQ